MNPALMKPEEVAERLAVSPKVVRQWLRDGRLPGIRLGRLWRVDPAELERVIREGFPQAREPVPKPAERKPGRKRPRRPAQRPQEAPESETEPKPTATPRGKDFAALEREIEAARKKGRRVAVLDPEYYAWKQARDRAAKQRKKPDA